MKIPEGIKESNLDYEYMKRMQEIKSSPYVFKLNTSDYPEDIAKKDGILVAKEFFDNNHAVKIIFNLGSYDTDRPYSVDILVKNNGRYEISRDEQDGSGSDLRCKDMDEVNEIVLGVSSRSKYDSDMKKAFNRAIDSLLTASAALDSVGLTNASATSLNIASSVIIQKGLFKKANSKKSVSEMLDDLDKKKNQGNWIPAGGGSESPFKTRSGRRLLYCWQPSTGKHAYLDCDTDLILSDEEAAMALL